VPLSNEHGSQVKDQGRRPFCHNRHKIFPYGPTRDISLRSEHASYLEDLYFTMLYGVLVLLYVFVYSYTAYIFGAYFFRCLVFCIVDVAHV
jgi:hypothetical protein